MLCATAVAVVAAAPVLAAAPATGHGRSATAATLSITNTVNGSHVTIANVGDRIHFVVTLRARGAASIETVVRDAMPAGLAVVASTASTGRYSPATGVWSIGRLTPGRTASLTVTASVVLVRGSAPRTIVNRAVSTARNARRSVSARATVAVNPALALRVVASSGDVFAPDAPTHLVSAASHLTYELSVANVGGRRATDVVVLVALPPDLALVPGSMPAGAGAVVLSHGTLTWRITSLARGASARLTYTEIANAPASPVRETTTATATSAQTAARGHRATAGRSRASWTVTVEPAHGSTAPPAADLAAAVTDNKSSIVPGGPTSYGVTITNKGPAAVAGATVFATLPTGFTPVPNVPVPAGITFADLGDGHVRWSGLTLAASASVVLQLPGTVATLLPAGIGPFVITVTVAPPTGTSELAAADNTAIDSDVVLPVADLAATVTDNGISVTPGGSDAYTITVTNNGPAAVSGATVIDTLPAGLLSAASPQLPSGVTFTDLGTGQVRWTGLTLAPGATVTLRLTGNVDGSLAAGTNTFVNTVSVTAPAPTVDSSTANNTATDTDSVVLPADLGVTLTDNAVNVVPGTSTTYTITVTNNGPAVAPGATLTDTLPTGLQTPSSPNLPSGVTFTNLGNGQVEWTGLIVPLGGSVQLHLSGTVDASLGAGTGTFVNTVTVSPLAGTVDPAAGNDAATDTDNVSPQADLAITMTDGLTLVVPGTSDAYTLTVSNSGPSAVSGATVIATLPGGMLTPSSPNLPSGVTFTDLGNGQVEWTGVALGAGAALQLTLNGTVSGALPAGVNTFVCGATVNVPAAVLDTNTSNNSVTDIDSVA